MAKSAAKRRDDAEPTNRRGHWQEQLAKSHKRWDLFGRRGKLVVDRYRLEREGSENELYQDRYNILYSTTETMRPSLYATTPKAQATQRHRDRENENVTLATLLIENACQYAIEEIDFDEVLNNCVEDYMLPGMGVAWVRYVPQFATRKKADAANDDDTYQELTFEGLDVDYVHYRDFRTGVGRVWKELPWVAKRVFFDRKAATKRFGADKAAKLTYSYRPAGENDGDRSTVNTGGMAGGDQAIIWEIWDKIGREALWYSDDYSDDLLDVKADPLKLKEFFPCPRPLRAVSTTSTFTPKSFYSQYKAQAEELDNLTQKIRVLTQALKLVGVYDASQEKLKDILSGTINKMVGVENWAAFAGTGGMNGAVQWVPIKEVAEVLANLLQQREVVKSEIYELTGFSDIQRGLSKASETLGAQEIKNQWAQGRLRSQQKEVQRFCRDIIRIMAEIISEQFSEDTLKVVSGFEPPQETPEERQAAAQYAEAVASGMQAPPPPPTGRQQAIAKFLEVVQLLKDEKERCAMIGIETDSTIMPDEAAERKDRMEFLGQIGAFLQQAGPMALQFPDMRGLLGAIMMFSIRTFRASRPLEQDFEEFQKKLAQQPAMPPPGSEGKPDTSAADAAKAQAEQAKLQAQQADAQRSHEAATQAAGITAQQNAQKAADDHAYRMAQLEVEKTKLQLEERKVQIEEAKLGIARQEHALNEAVAIADDERQNTQQQHEHTMEQHDAAREDTALELGQGNTERQQDHAESEAEAAREAEANAPENNA